MKKVLCFVLILAVIFSIGTVSAFACEFDPKCDCGQKDCTWGKSFDWSKDCSWDKGCDWGKDWGKDCDKDKDWGKDCDWGKEKKCCEHEWAEDYTIDIEATCAYCGSKSIHCIKCGAKKPGSCVILPKLDHELKEKVITPGTCITKGKTLIYCKNCCYFTFKCELDPDNHVGGEEIRDAKDPTYDEEGYTGDTYCKGCGALLKKGEVIPKLVKPEEKENDVPKTGDESNVALFGICGIMSALVLAVLVISKKKVNN